MYIYLSFIVGSYAGLTRGCGLSTKKDGARARAPDSAGTRTPHPLAYPYNTHPQHGRPSAIDGLPAQVGISHLEVISRRDTLYKASFSHETSNA